MGIADSMKKAAFSTAFSYIGKNPEENAPKLMAWVDKFAGEGPDSFPAQRAAIRNVINDKDNNMHQLVMDIMKDTDPDVLKATFMNFFLNANIIGWPKQEQNRKKYNCNIPWAILLDPTSACNLHCTGCWAAEYGNKLNLTLEEIDSIIKQGKELGVYMYIYTGGEPLVRKKDIIRLCEMHPDCVTCKPGCSDCCHAMFDLSLVEAMYLNARFIEKYDFGPERSRILENAGSVDRKLTRMKRDYFRELRDAKGSEDAMEHIMEEAANAREIELQENDESVILQRLEDAGMEVNEVDKEAFIERMSDIWARFDEEYGEEWIDLALAVIRQFE